MAVLSTLTLCRLFVDALLAELPALAPLAAGLSLAVVALSLVIASLLQEVETALSMVFVVPLLALTLIAVAPPLVGAAWHPGLVAVSAMAATSAVALLLVAQLAAAAGYELHQRPAPHSHHHQCQSTRSKVTTCSVRPETGSGKG